MEWGYIYIGWMNCEKALKGEKTRDKWLKVHLSKKGAVQSAHD